jgi:hypothetical protein
MKPNDKIAFAKIMAMLATAYRTQLTREQMAIYYDNLCDIDAGKVEDAVRRIVRTRPGGYLPTIAEIRREALGQTGPSLHIAAEEAWAYALRFIGGPYYAWLASDLQESKPRPDVDRIICGTYRTWTDFMEALDADSIRFMKHDFVESWLRRKEAAVCAELEAADAPAGLLNAKRED